MIAFSTSLLRPADSGGDDTWHFLVLPQDASDRLPSRGMVSVNGKLNDAEFQATLEPDGKGGHWLRVDHGLQIASGCSAGDTVRVELEPVKEEPEPKVPSDLQEALENASPRVREIWMEITPLARRDWVQWVTTAKKAETRAKRISNACDMLMKGKRRPCCFDRSGMYSKGIACPVPLDTSS